MKLCIGTPREVKQVTKAQVGKLSHRLKCRLSGSRASLITDIQNQVHGGCVCVCVCVGGGGGGGM